MILTSCSPEVSSGQNKCGVLIPYSDEEQNAAKKELVVLQQAGVYPNALNLVHDYKLTRDSIRDCIANSDRE